MEHEYLLHLERWEEGDFRAFMIRFGQDIWNYAYFMTKRRDAADDIAQETFIKAYTHISQFRGQSTVKTWLLTITRRLALNYFRSAFIRKVTLVDRWSSNEVSRSAEQEVIDQWNSEHIWQAVLKLPLKYREVLLLTVHYSLSGREIADLLGVAEGTVKSRLSRARSKVNEQLRKEGMIYDTV